jgi:hypothetical protein
MKAEPTDTQDDKTTDLSISQHKLNIRHLTIPLYVPWILLETENTELHLGEEDTSDHWT